MKGFYIADQRDGRWNLMVGPFPDQKTATEALTKAPKAWKTRTLSIMSAEEWATQGADE